jgi:hypothetical protein
VILRNTRRIQLRFSSAYPLQELFSSVLARFAGSFESHGADPGTLIASYPPCDLPVVKYLFPVTFESIRVGLEMRIANGRFQANYGTLVRLSKSPL